MSALIAALSAKHGLPTVDAGSVEAFLLPSAGECRHALLFFTGDPAERSDSGDVAVVLPELLAAFPGQFRAAIVGRNTEAELKARFGVQVFPSLVVTRETDIVAIIPRIRDWSDYMERLSAALDLAAAALDVADRPRVEFTHSVRELPS